MRSSPGLRRVVQHLVGVTALLAMGCGDSDTGASGTGGSTGGDGGTSGSGGSLGTGGNGAAGAGGGSGGGSAWNVAVTGALNAEGSGTIMNAYSSITGVTLDGNNATSGSSATIHAKVSLDAEQTGITDLNTLLFTLDDGTACGQTYDTITNHGLVSATVNNGGLETYDVDFIGWADCDGAGEVEVTGSYAR